MAGIKAMFMIPADVDAVKCMLAHIIYFVNYNLCNCAATSRQDVVVKHEADDSSDEKHRRQWDDQDVSHLLSVLDNAELSSSCSASQTSCSGSVSQTSCVMDDAIDAAAVIHRSPDSHMTESSEERQTQIKDESGGHSDASLADLSQTAKCNKTLAAAAAAVEIDQDAGNNWDDDDDTDDRTDEDEEYTDDDDDDEVNIGVPF